MTDPCIHGDRSGTFTYVNTGNGPKGGLNAAIAATLNGERVAQGYTFDQLADTTGISARSLKRYLSGAERDLTVATLGTIATALELPIHEVIRRAELWLERNDDVEDTAGRIVAQARANAQERHSTQHPEATRPERKTRGGTA